MIKYDAGSFGWNILFRLHGSAVWKSLFPSFLSSALFLILYFYADIFDNRGSMLYHPYPITALIAALTFLLAFRANFAYNRYWEAFTAVHMMHSKWVDVGMELAAFHLQAHKYDDKKPPSFGAHPELKFVERERLRENEMTYTELQQHLDEALPPRGIHRVLSALNVGASSRKGRGIMNASAAKMNQKPKNAVNNLENINDNNDNDKDNHPLKQNSTNNASSPTTSSAASTTTGTTVATKPRIKSINKPTFADPPKTPKKTSIIGNAIQTNAAGHTTRKTHRRTVSKLKSKQYVNLWSSSPVNSNENSNNTNSNNNNSNNNNNNVVIGSSSCGVNVAPRVNHAAENPLFLEECAHLLSLLSAVALSTLRNDLETASSPLITFTPGEPFPHVDPDAYTADVRREWTKSTHKTFTVISYLFGHSRTVERRTLYNAARPFRVIGGVSDAEIELLQAARGPLAKVALVSMWLQEFISREYLAGSTGDVAPPILSRLYQFVSDGMLGYNQARKIAYIPFPFPHAQITSLFVFAVGMFVPVLMLQFVTNVYLAFFLNLMTVMSFTGLHEVARELESPFMNVPNEVPCNNFQGQFNEALMTMFTGYHPDAYWEVKTTTITTTLSTNTDDNENLEVRSS